MKDTEKFDLNDKELKETPEKIKKFRDLIESTTKQDKEKAKLQNEKGKFKLQFFHRILRSLAVLLGLHMQKKLLILWTVL